MNRPPDRAMPERAVDMAISTCRSSHGGRTIQDFLEDSETLKSAPTLVTGHLSPICVGVH